MSRLARRFTPRTLAVFKPGVGDRGFTILEILVAFFILTILLGLLYEAVKDTATLGQKTYFG